MAVRPVSQLCPGCGMRLFNFSSPLQTSPRAPRPAREPRREPNRRDDSTVIGMGDHMPDFLTRSFVAATPSGD